jgi:hypothetical protein
MTTLADALAGGSRYIKWDDLGVKSSVSGTIVNVEMRQARKFQSTDLDFWDDGKPKMQAIVTISTDQRDPADPEDDGTRSISINLWSGQKQALAAACKAAGVAEPQPGQTFTATWASGVGKTGDPRIFSYSLSNSAGLSDAIGVNTATGEVQPAAPAAPPIDAAAAAAALSNLTPEQRQALGL